MTTGSASSSIEMPPHELQALFSPRQMGTVLSVKGTAARVRGLTQPVESICRVGSADGPLAQIVSFELEIALIMPMEENIHWAPGQRIYAQAHLSPPSSDHLLGRVVDGLGRPLDGLGPISSGAATSAAHAINPMERRRLSQQLDVGVRAINALMPVAKGQRLGIFAGSGVGKSTLLSMMAKHTSADAVVIALIGERSREVREFVEDNLGARALHKSVVVAVSAGESALMKIQGANYACLITEQMRARGHSCLLIMDSLTRFAMACREVGLACGETPATKGYPPSAFAKLNALVERAGAGSDKRQDGEITAFYTVLSEGDDMQDPIADTARAILDGHIVLSRSIAERGTYPPIDVSASVSRATGAISSPEEKKLMLRYRQLLGSYSQNEDLVKAGAYQAGQDPLLDQAIAKIDKIQKFIQQNQDEAANIQESFALLKTTLS